MRVAVEADADLAFEGNFLIPDNLYRKEIFAKVSVFVQEFFDKSNMLMNFYLFLVENGKKP